MTTTPAYAPTDRTTMTRGRHRASFDRALVHRVLDEARICHVGFVAGGEPVVLPTIHTRVGERLYLHGSTGSRLARLAAAGDLRVCVTVTLLDGLVLARSAFHHSMNYRSVVVHGPARPVTDDGERRQALDAVVDHVLAGRSGACRPPSPRELAATSVLCVDLVEASAKVRDGDPVDEPEDAAGPWWAGVIGVRQVLDPPRAAADLAPTGQAAPISHPGAIPKLHGIT